MTSLSPGASLAWKVALYEAVHLNAGYVEKEHLFIGLLSLEKMISESPDQPNESLAREWDALASLLAITGHDPVVLRRLMRSALRTGTEVRAGAVVHRSPACRQVFSRAAEFAGDRPAGVPDLFSAIMEQPGETIASVLAEGRQCVAAARQTDVFVPAGEMPGVPTRTAPLGFDLKASLLENIARYNASLSRWPEASREHALTVQAVCRAAAGVAHLCLDDGDSTGLAAALSDLARFPCYPGKELHRLVQDVGAARLEGGALPEPLKERIRILLREG